MVKNKSKKTHDKLPKEVIRGKVTCKETVGFIRAHDKLLKEAFRGKVTYQSKRRIHLRNLGSLDTIRK
jgi:hypothetical protein